MGCCGSREARDEESYIIVGAGAFGASTALHLIQKHPSAKVYLLDRGPFPHEAGASWDWNKVIRADYTTPVYMELALEALQKWRKDPLYQKFFHQSGLAWVSNSDFAQTIIDNYRAISGSKSQPQLLNTQDVLTMWGGIHADALYQDVKQVFYNKTSGWAEATDALCAVINAALAAGVRYVEADVKKVLFDDRGSAIGVVTEEGNCFHASHTILATGAMTARILADSAPMEPKLQLGGRMVAAAICSAMVKVSETDATLFKKGPVFVNDLDPAIGGSLPPNSNNELKVYRDESFKNTILHEASGQQISVPPSKLDYGQRDLTPGMKEELKSTFEGIFGEKAKDWELFNYRICWDAVTPTQDPIICEHPHAKKLFLVTGGSFHGYKFLPIIGKYAVDMIEDKLRPELAKIWAWDKENKGEAHEGMFPTREMADV
ncbi:putative sarcosine oxidase [Cercophora samala]|uniref:Sarcosine oxidase n=1 Tax=Cercophora samala TaxID=330535 RepID=A0AA40D3G1_9PEZI|nr:putative sarcosine oxidase [Cercophora samala]